MRVVLIAVALLVVGIVTRLSALDMPPTVATPATATPATVTAKTAQLTVTGTDDGGAAALTYSWTATGPANVTVSPNGTNAAKTATATFTTPGTYTITAKIADQLNQSVTSAVTVTVVSTPSAMDTISTGTSILNPGQTKTYTGVVYNQFGTIVTAPAPVTWSMASGSGSINASGVYTAALPTGFALVRGTCGSLTNTAQVQVNAVPTVASPVSTASTSITAATAAFTVQGADDQSVDLLNYTWTATGPGSVSFSPANSLDAEHTVATFTAPGAYTITARIADKQSVFVTSALNVTVVSTPSAMDTMSTGTSILNPGQTKTFTGVVYNQFGTIVAAPGPVTWSMASGPGSINASGVYTAALPTGFAFVRSTCGTLTNTARVQVNAAPTIAQAVHTDGSPLRVATPLALGVVGADDTNEVNLTYTWSVTSGVTNGVTFSANGTNTAKNTTITVSQTGSYTVQALIRDPQGLSVASAITLTFTAAQVTPTITWATPNAITYGVPLSAAQLNAASPVAGTFAYTPALGAKPNAGTQALTATFTPTDSVTYTTATATVQLVIQPATPVLSWPVPPVATWGTVLSATQLNAASVAGIPGTFAYTPDVGTTPEVGTQALSVIFTPTDGLNYTTASHSVSLTVTQAPTSVTWATPAPITYGTALGATQLAATATISGTFDYSPLAGTVLSAGARTLSVIFTPTDAVHYAPATASVSLAVNPATPALTWAAPAPITWGTALSTTQLAATAVPAGQFTYAPLLGTTPDVGNQTLSVVFTPTDAANFTTATASVPLTVTQATPVITWAAPAPFTYGTSLGDGQLGATANVSGTFAYLPLAGTVLPAGSRTLSVTFTPTDAVHFTTATASVPVVVAKATPILTWATPAAIDTNTPLSAIQLSASAGIDGTYAYTPALGTTLSAGSHTLTVQFTPTDAANFTSATASVSVVVNVVDTSPTLRIAATVPETVEQTPSYTYVVRTSQDPGGPAYTFRDLSQESDLLTLTLNYGYPIDYWSEAEDFTIVEQSPDDSGYGYGYGFPAALGFTFPFYGQPQTSVLMSMNGWLNFGPGTADDQSQYGFDSFYGMPKDSELAAVPLPSLAAPKGLIAAYWKDLIPDSSTHIYAKRLDADHFAVQYQSFAWYADPTQHVTFEVVLASNGVITVAFQDVPLDMTGVVLGVQDFAGQQAVTAGLDRVVLVPGTLISYVPAKRVPSPGIFTITRSGGDLAQSITVPVTISGTAVGGTDYEAIDDTVLLPSGVASATLRVDASDNFKKDPPRTVIVSLGNVTGYTTPSTDRSATVTIDSPNRPEVAFAVATSVVTDDAGLVQVPVVLSSAATQPLAISYRVTGGTAVSGSNFSLAGTTLSVTPGQQSAAIPLQIIANPPVAPDRTVEIELYNPVAVDVGAIAHQVITIHNSFVPSVNVLTATPATVTGTTAVITALAVDDQPLANLTWAWSSTGPVPVTVASTGDQVFLATFTRAGMYTLTAVVTDQDGLTGSKSVDVFVVATPTTASITPASTTVDIGTTTALQAQVTDQFGQLIPNASVTWTADIGTCDGSGIYHAPATATGNALATVQAIVSPTLAATALVHVRNVNPSLTTLVQPASGSYFGPLAVSMSSVNASATCWYAIADTAENLPDIDPATAGVQMASGPVYLTHSGTVAARSILGTAPTGAYGPVQTASYHVVDPATVVLTAPSQQSISPAIATLSGDLAGFQVEAVDGSGHVLATQSSIAGTQDFVVPLNVDASTIQITVRDAKGVSVVRTASIQRSTINPSVPDQFGDHLTASPDTSLWFATPLSSGGVATQAGVLNPGDGGPSLVMTPGQPVSLHYAQPGIYQLQYQSGATVVSKTVWVIQARFPAEEIVVLAGHPRIVGVQVFPPEARAEMTFSVDDSTAIAVSTGLGVRISGDNGVRTHVLVHHPRIPGICLESRAVTLCKIINSAEIDGVIQGTEIDQRWGWSFVGSKDNELYGYNGYYGGYYTSYLLRMNLPHNAAPLIKKSSLIRAYPAQKSCAIIRLQPTSDNISYQLLENGTVKASLNTASADAQGPARLNDGSTSYILSLSAISRTQKSANELPKYGTLTSSWRTIEGGKSVDLMGPKVFTPVVSTVELAVSPKDNWKVMHQSWGPKELSISIKSNAISLADHAVPESWSITANQIYHSEQFSSVPIISSTAVSLPVWRSAKSCLTSEGLIDHVSAVSFFDRLSSYESGFHQYMDPVTVGSYVLGSPLGVMSSYSYNFDATDSVWDYQGALKVDGPQGRLATSTQYQLYSAFVQYYGSDTGDAAESDIRQAMSSFLFTPEMRQRPTGSWVYLYGYPIDFTVREVLVPFTGGVNPEYDQASSIPPTLNPTLPLGPQGVTLHAFWEGAELKNVTRTGSVTYYINDGQGGRGNMMADMKTRSFQLNGKDVVAPIVNGGRGFDSISSSGAGGWNLAISQPGLYVIGGQEQSIDVAAVGYVNGNRMRTGAGFEDEWPTFQYLPGVSPIYVSVTGVSSLATSSSGVIDISTVSNGDNFANLPITISIPPTNLGVVTKPGDLTTVLAPGDQVLPAQYNALTHSWQLGVVPTSLAGIYPLTIHVDGTSDKTTEIIRPLSVGLTATAHSWMQIVPNAVTFDPASGNVRFSRPVTTYSTRDPGPDVVLTYNSLDGTTTGVGTGWRTNYDSRVVDGTWWIDEFGGWWNFDTVVTSPAAHLTARSTRDFPTARLLTRSGDAAQDAQAVGDGFKPGEIACVTLGDGRAMFYDTHGWLVRVSHQQGGDITVTRDPLTGYAQSAADASGRSTQDLTQLNLSGLATTLDLNAQESGAWHFTFTNGKIRRMESVSWTDGGTSQKISLVYKQDDPSITSDDAVANRLLSYAYSSGQSSAQGAQPVTWTVQYAPQPFGTSKTTVGIDGNAASKQEFLFQGTKFNPLGKLNAYALLSHTDYSLVPGGLATTYAYGNVTTSAPTLIQIGGTSVVTQDFDALGRLATRTTQAGGAVPALVEDFSYTYSTGTLVPLVPASTTPLVSRYVVHNVTGVNGGTIDAITRYAYVTKGSRSGLLSSRVDPDQTETTWAYTGDGKLASWTDSHGKAWTVSKLGAWGDVQEVTLPGSASRKQTSIVDQYGYVTSVSGFIGGATASIPDANHHQVGTTTSPDGVVSTVSLSANDLPAAVTTKTPTTTSGLITTTVTTSYDSLGRPIREQVSGRTDITTSYTLQTDTTKPGWLVTRLQGSEILGDAWIDFAGRTRETYQWVTKVGGTDAPQQQTTAYTYSPTDGRLTTITPPVDTPIQVAADFMGRIFSTAQGSATTSRTVNVLGWELSSTDANGQTSQVFYDAAGRVKQTKNPAGGWQWLTYDAAGNLTATESSTGVHTANEFDDAGILTATIDGFGRRTEQAITSSSITWKDPQLSSLTATATLDGALRVTQHQVTGTGLTATTTITPGAAGDGTMIPAGRKEVASTVDSLGRPLRSTVTTTLGGNADAVFGTTIGYQANTDRPTTATRDDGLIEQDIPDPVSGEVNEHKSNAHAVAPVTTMLVLVRDAQGRVLRWRDADQHEHARTFDSLGRLATSTPAGQATTTYTYQGGGDRVDTVSNTVDGSRQYTYHPLGGVRSVMHDSVEEQAADYDQDGRVLWTRTKGVTRSTSYDPITGVVASTTAPDGATTYHRNARGLVTRIDYPANRSVVLDYDGNERLEKRTYADTTFEQVVYDANGDVQKTRDRAGSWTTVAARDGTGAVSQITTAGGSRQVATALRSGGGFVMATTETVGSTSSVASITSDAGGATLQTEFPGQDPIMASVTAGGRIASRGSLSYAYSDPNTVVVSDGGVTRATLGYQQGRLVSAALPNGHTRSVSYQNGKLYQSIEQVNGTSWTTTYGWRSDDRLASRSTPFESETYTYGTDKLTGWQRTGRAAATASYGFDAAGHRTSEEVVRSEGTQQVAIFTTAVAPLEASLGTWEATGTAAAGTGGVGLDALATLSPGSNPLTYVSATVSLPQPTTSWRGISLVVNLTRTATGDLVAWDEWRALLTAKAGVTTLEGVFLRVDADGEHEIARTAAVTAPTATTAILTLTRQPGGLLATIQPTGTGTTMTVAPLTVPIANLRGRIGVAAAADGGIAQASVSALRWTQAASYRARAYAFNAVDQITSITEQTEGGTRTGTPSYDTRGNQTGIAWSDGTSQSNDFDPWNRLTSQTVNGQTVGMTYIPGGVERLSRGNVTYRRDAQGLLGVTTGSTTTSFGLYGSLPLFESKGGTVTSLVVDPDRTVRGRVGTMNGSSPMFLSRIFTDPTGEVPSQLLAQVDQQQAGSGAMFMGQPTAETTIPNGYVWQDGVAVDGLAWRGRWYDAASKQAHGGERVLDTPSGSFLSADPLGYAGSPSLMAYPWDPINGADDSGRFWEVQMRPDGGAYVRWNDSDGKEPQPYSFAELAAGIQAAQAAPGSFARLPDAGGRGVYDVYSSAASSLAIERADVDTRFIFGDTAPAWFGAGSAIISSNEVGAIGRTNAAFAQLGFFDRPQGRDLARAMYYTGKYTLYDTPKAIVTEPALQVADVARLSYARGAGIPTSDVEMLSGTGQLAQAGLDAGYSPAVVASALAAPEALALAGPAISGARALPRMIGAMQAEARAARQMSMYLDEMMQAPMMGTGRPQGILGMGSAFPEGNFAVSRNEGGGLVRYDLEYADSSNRGIIQGVYDPRAKTLSIDVVRAFEKGKGLGTALYGRLIEAVRLNEGGVRAISGQLQSDNKAKFLSAGLEATPAYKIRRRFGFSEVLEWPTPENRYTLTMGTP